MPLAPTRMPVRLASVLLLAALNAPRVGAQTITPRFAWPVGAIGEVTIRVRSNTTVTSGLTPDALQDSSGILASSTMEVRAHPEGLLIISTPTRRAAVTGAAMGDLGAMLSLPTSYVVSREGAFRHLENVDAMQRAMDSLLAPMRQQVEAAAPQMAASLKAMSSPEALGKSYAQSWQQLGGVIYGRSWAPADSDSTSVSLPMPMVPGGAVLLPRLTRYDGVVSCPAGRQGTCWQFTMRQSLTRAAMRGVMTEMLKQMGLDAGMIDQVPIPESTTTTVLLFDAATMLPLSVTSNSSGGGDGAMMAMTSTANTITTYRWK